MKSNAMKKKYKDAGKGHVNPLAGETPSIPEKDTSLSVARRLRDRNTVAPIAQVINSAPVQQDKRTTKERLALLHSLLSDDPVEIADQIATLAVLTNALQSNEDASADKQ